MNFEINKKQYVDFKVYSVTKIKSKYGFRVKLIYDDESFEIQQKSGFKTKRKAESERNIVITQLHNRTYVVYSNVTVEEYFNYWLEKVMRNKKKISYNSYMSYRNVIHNYINYKYGKLKMTNLNMGHIQKLYKWVFEQHESVAQLTKTVVATALKYAKQKNVISSNPALTVNLPKSMKKKEYRKRNIDSSKTLNILQVKKIIESSKETPIHLQIMFAVLMGMRLSEINALKYSDIDFVNRKLYIDVQLGVDLKKDKKDCKKKTVTKQEVEVKTPSSKRGLPIPDILFEEILEQRKIYEKNRNRRINDKSNPFNDKGYICCSTYGNSRSRSFHQKYYKQLLKDNNLPDIRFHDLRHTYSTILLKANFDVKAISELLGHASEIITVDVYCEKEEIIFDCLDILEPFIESVMPKEKEKGFIYDYSNDVEINCILDECINELLIA